MRNSAKQMADKVKDDFVDPVAKSAAKGSDKFAKGSEAFAEGARKMADKTQDWADEMTGARRRRNLILLALALTIIGAVVVMLIQSTEK